MTVPISQRNQTVFLHDKSKGITRSQPSTLLCNTSGYFFRKKRVMRFELNTHFQEDVQTGNVRAEKILSFEDYSRNPVDLVIKLILPEKSVQTLRPILPLTPILEEQCTAAPGCPWWQPTPVLLLIVHLT